MDKIKMAAIIMLGMGDRLSSDVLKYMSSSEIEKIIEVINNADNFGQKDVIDSLNTFIRDVEFDDGITTSSKESLKSSLYAISENKKIQSLSDGLDHDKSKWLDLFKIQPVDLIYTMIESEHPQVIAVIIVSILESDKASIILKKLPQEIRKEVVIRMAKIGQISTLAMEILSTMFAYELKTKDNYSNFEVNSVESVINILSHLDTDTEKEIIDDLAKEDSNISDEIIDKSLPFETLVQLDKRSLQVLISELDTEDMVMALKGSDQSLRAAFFNNMASKSADILKDELESKGPVKLAYVIEAQKKIITIAKRLNDEEKIMLKSKQSNDIVY